MAEADRMDRLQRVLSVFLTLRQSWEPLTRIELEDRFPIYRGVSGRRRFEDDKDLMKKTGIPIVTAHAPDGIGTTYSVDPDFYLPDLGLTDDEAIAFGLAVQSIDLRDVTWNQLAGTKLGAWAPESAGAIAHLPTSRLLPHLTDAVANRRRIRFVYNDAEPREVDPYAVVLARGHWYVPSYCHRRQQLVAFRVDRIDPDSLVELEDKAFERPADFDARSAVPLDPRTMGAEPEVRAVLRVDRGFLPIVLADLRGKHDVQDPVEGADEVLVEIAVSHVPALLSWVLQFGDRIEVVEPPELRQRVIDWLTDLVALEDEPRSAQGAT